MSNKNNGFRGLNRITRAVLVLGVLTAFFCLAALPRPALAVITIHVSTADDGDPAPTGSLREAITTANGAADDVEIVFDGNYTILLVLALPPINNPTHTITIDGSGYSIFIDGTATVGAVGLQVVSENNTIKNLRIIHFAWGIQLSGGHNTVQGCYLGNDGTAAHANATGIWIYGSGNTIGGTNSDPDPLTPPDVGNIISGNSSYGVCIIGSSATLNTVSGNYIGPNKDGDAVPTDSTQQCGVYISDAPSNTIGGENSPEVLDVGNVISGNTDYGIRIWGSGSNNNKVIGNYIGTNVAGDAPLGSYAGIFISGGAQENTIGGTAAGERNVISGNNFAGVLLADTSFNNNVRGNYIGTNSAGTLSVPNSYGVCITASSNTIGGENSPGVLDVGNVISGNTDYGVYINSSEANSNIVSGNYIGTKVNGTEALANNTGVYISSGAQSNTIGGTTAGERNVIAGNTNYGVYITGSGTNTNTVSGNYVGTNKDGDAVPGGTIQSYGVVIYAGAQSNIIGGTTDGKRNVISGNGTGVLIGGIGDASSNVVSGNYIGTKANGTEALANNTNGICMSGDANNNTIGGNIEGEINVISGNLSVGIWISTNGNVISGNYIGTGATGTEDLGNGSGVYIFDGGNNTIGGTTGGERNVISGNTNYGVAITGSGTNNTVSGNYIGINATSTAALANGHGVYITAGAQSNTIGGAIAGERNVISGNANYGVYITGSGTTGNTVSGNYIGTKYDGLTALANNYGVYISNEASSNTIGGDSEGERNIISGNTSYGVYISGAGTNSNTVSGNYIGPTADGISTLANPYGIFFTGGVTGSVIGGNTAGERNIISGNTHVGIEVAGPDDNGIVISNNYIGTDPTGAFALGENKIGIWLGGRLNTVGGDSPDEKNVICDHNHWGIYLLGSENSIIGNYIGVDSSGGTAIANATGIEIFGSGATLNVVGSGSSTERNVISGNNIGIDIGVGANANSIFGNYIGLNATGTFGVPNSTGIHIRDGSNNNLVGTSDGDTNKSNHIWHNGQGIYCTGATTIRNTFRLNSIYNNSGLGIDLFDNANEDIAAPSFDFPSFVRIGDNVTVTGHAPASSTVEFFWVGETADLSGAGEGKQYLDNVTADGSGNFVRTLSLTGISSPAVLSATATDTEGNTSEFAANATSAESTWSGPNWYVDIVNGSDTLGDGGPSSDPTQAFYDPASPGHRPWRHISYALSQASVVSTHTINIAPGTYSVGSGETETANAMIELKDGVNLLGVEDAYLPPTLPADIILSGGSARRVVYGESITISTTLSYLTIVQGLINVSGTDYIGGAGLRLESCSSALSIENCTFSDNKSYGTRSFCGGGGIYCNSSHPNIEDCTFISNSGDTGSGAYEGGGGGGAILLYNSHPAISVCIFSDNITNGGGGAIFCIQNAAPSITNCTFDSNHSLGLGGGNYSGGGALLLCNPSTIVQNCTITNNTAYHFWHSGGGGIYVSHAAGGGDDGPTIENCTISGNSGGGSGDYSGGGGIYCFYSDPIINKCLIINNITNTSASDHNGGGGVYCGDGAPSPTLTNCLISKNETISRGGGLYYYTGSAALMNCTVAENYADGEGAGIYDLGSASTATNTIIAAGTGGSYEVVGGTYQYCDIWRSEDDTPWDGATIGPGCFDPGENPMFTPSPGVDPPPPVTAFGLSTLSPCADSGTNVGAPPDDIEGGHRPQPDPPILPSTGFSMGCYEVAGSTPLPPAAEYYVDNMYGSNANWGDSWGDDRALATIEEAVTRANADPPLGRLVTIYIAGNNIPQEHLSDPPAGDGSGARDPYNISSDLDLALAGGGSISLIGAELDTGELWDTGNPYHAHPVPPTSLSPTARIALASGIRIKASGIGTAYPFSIKGLRIENGAGIDLDLCQSSVTIEDCEIENNNSVALGGGVFIKDTTGYVTLDGCRLAGNSSSDGGGLAVSNSRAEVTDCFFKQNYATSRGGAIYFDGLSSYLKVDDSQFIDNNHAGSQGGAIYAGAGPGSTFNLLDSTFDDCRSAGAGGALYLASGATTVTEVTGSTFTNNRASGLGGAIANVGQNVSVSRSRFTTNTVGGGWSLAWNGSSGSLTNCLFIESSGGEIYVTTNPILDNCTLVSTSGTGVYLADSATPAIKNSILSGTNGYRIYADSAEATPIITYCDIYNDTPTTPSITLFKGDSTGGGWEGSYKKLGLWGWDGDHSVGNGCLAMNPVLDAAYRLLNTSPCINAGLSGEGEDLDGASRTDGHTDIGCDEYTAGPTLAFASSPQDSLITGTDSAHFILEQINASGGHLSYEAASLELYDADGTTVTSGLATFTPGGSLGHYTLVYNKDHQPYQLQVRARSITHTLPYTSQTVRFTGASGRNFYVNPASGNDETGDGYNSDTESNKWKNLSWALWTLKNPDPANPNQVNLAEGTYKRGSGPIYQEYPYYNVLFWVYGDISIKGGENLGEAANYILDGESLYSVIFGDGMGADSFIKGVRIRKAGSGNRGLALQSSSVKVSECEIIEGQPMFGGITINGGQPYFYHCRIKDNGSLSEDGGGAMIMDSRSTFDRCYITNNTGYRGGGLLVSINSTVNLVNCLVTANQATSGSGGAGYSWDSNLTLINSTIADNTATEGAAFNLTNSSLRLCNSLLVNNSGTYQIYNAGGSSLSSTSSDLHLNTTYNLDFPVGSGGNISADPNFGGAYTYDLVYPSPAIDSGTPSSDSGGTTITAPAEDIEGRGRPFNEGYDQGAYEARFARIKATVAPQRLYAGVPSEAFTVTLYNADGSEYTGGATLTLVTSSEQGWFSAARKPFENITTLSIPAGSSSGTFYYRDKKEGQVTLTISPPSSSWAPAHATLTVYPRLSWQETF